MKNGIISILLVFSLSLFLSSCASVNQTLKYGFIPANDYEYYSSLNKVDLKKHKYKLVILDQRDGNTINCSKIMLPRDTELEGKAGYDYFIKYVHTMIEENNGVIDSTADDTITIRLQGLSGELSGVLIVRIWGLVQFDVEMKNSSKTYCSAMADGDKDSPVGIFSIDSRKGAFRKMVSASTRKSIEEFLHDLEKNQNL